MPLATIGLLAACIPVTLADTSFHTESFSTVWSWIFLLAIIFFCSIGIALLCCTRQAISLPLDEDFGAEFDEWPLEREEDLATLSEDALLSYARAKGKENGPQADLKLLNPQLTYYVFHKLGSSKIHLIACRPI